MPIIQTPKNTLEHIRTVNIIWWLSLRHIGAKKFLNHSHSSLLNVLKRCFDTLKARFSILKRLAQYSSNAYILCASFCTTSYDRGLKRLVVQVISTKNLVIIDNNNEGDNDINEKSYVILPHKWDESISKRSNKINREGNTLIASNNLVCYSESSTLCL